MSEGLKKLGYPRIGTQCLSHIKLALTVFGISVKLFCFRKLACTLSATKVRVFAKFSGEKNNLAYETASLQEYGSNFTDTKKKKNKQHKTNNLVSLQEFMIQRERTGASFLSPLSQSSYKPVSAPLTRLLDSRNVCIPCV